MPRISIAIPFHDSPHSAFYLSRLLKSIAEQTLTDYEIVLTKEGSMAHNHNAAILRSKGKIIQMMQMDDYFAHPDALKEIAERFEEGVRTDNGHDWGTNYPKWCISACLHENNGIVGSPHTPEWTDDIYTGNNRLGSISTLAMRQGYALLFEEPLQWVVDCDLYYRLYLKYGLPKFIDNPAVVIQERPDRLTHTLSSQLKEEEVQYLKRKYVNRE